MKTEKRIPLSKAFSLHYRAFQILQKNCPGLLPSIFFHSAVGAVLPYVGIYFSAQLLNELAGERRAQSLWMWALLAAASTMILTLFKAIFSRWKNQKMGTFQQDTGRIYVDKLLRMDFCVLDDSHTHDLHSQIKQNDNWMGWGLYRATMIFEELVEAIIGILSAVSLTVGLFLLPVPGTSSLSFLNHPLFPVAALVVLLLFSFLSSICATKSDSYWISTAEEQKFLNRLYSFFGYTVHGRDRALDMRLYDQQEICSEILMTQGQEMFGRGSKIVRYALGPMGLLMASASAISAVFIGLSYLFVCLKAWAGAFGVGSVTQYVGAITALSSNITFLMRVLGELYNNAKPMETVFAFLDLPDRMYQGTLTTEKRSDRQYEVEFRDVSFRYPGTHEYALRHVTMKFRIGERLAIVGRNGSGKTTFIKLLCRLYDPDEGEILLNGIDIRKYNYQDYLRVFSVVFQDFQLLPFPLGENVAASYTVDRERAEHCLRVAGFGDRLDSMPDGLNTFLTRDFSEKGVTVSGGEAQKIALARALYRDAPFIILDEPTAALDPVAEYEVYTHFNDLVGDKTAVYISHRLSSCRFCDAIAVFDHGQIVQQGTHESLLQDKNGVYAALWEAQAQYYREHQEGSEDSPQE